MSNQDNIQVARAAVDEAHLLATTGGSLEQIAPIVALAHKAFADQDITDTDLDAVTAQLAHKVRVLRQES